MKYLLLTTLLISAAVPAEAADHKWGLSLLGGSVKEEKHADVNNHEGMMTGVQLSRRFGSILELSFGYSYAKVNYTSQLLPGVKVKYRDHFGPLCLAYRFGGALSGLYVGPQAALVTRTYVKDNDDVGLTSTGFGGRLGYDFAIGSRFAFGAQANYLKVAKAERTITDDNVRTTYSVDATSFCTMLLSVQYRFW